VTVQLRLVDPERELDLSVGALVVYGSHGIGRVCARTTEKRDRAGEATVVLEFQSGLSVILPLERAETCLRPPAGASELADVRATLRCRDVPVERSWQARTRATRARIAVGEPAGLAEVVRDGVERQRRHATGSTLSSVEQELYLKARRLLVPELVHAAGIDEVEAEAWIDDQLKSNHE
jgi:RNA polymerase-interacting CarD/CdnL/TRCF family regulator